MAAVARAPSAHGQRRDGESETFVAHSLRADGFDAGEDGTGRGTPLVPVAFSANHSNQGIEIDDVCPTLNVNAPQAVAYQCQGNNVGEAGTLRGGNGGLTGGVPFVFDTTQMTNPLHRGTPIPNGPSHTLAAGAHPPSIAGGMAVRRLTPVECERLQGFSDDYTAVPYRSKPAADGPRYRALGNSMAVPCMSWLGKRIQMVEEVSA